MRVKLKTLVFKEIFLVFIINSIPEHSLIGNIRIICQQIDIGGDRGFSILYHEGEFVFGEVTKIDQPS